LASEEKNDGKDLSRGCHELLKRRKEESRSVSLGMGKRGQREKKRLRVSCVGRKEGGNARTGCWHSEEEEKRAKLTSEGKTKQAARLFTIRSTKRLSAADRRRAKIPYPWGVTLSRSD